MGDDRANRYIENGQVVYRASSLGMCVKSLAALGMGMTPADHPDWLLAKFAQGVRGESKVIAMLNDVARRDGAWRVMSAQEGHWFRWEDGQILIEMAVGERVIVRGHADGVGVCWALPLNAHYELGERRLIEVKCVSEGYAKTVLNELPVMYQVQISVYAGVLGMKAVLALGVKDDDGVVVRVETQPIDILPWGMGRIKARVSEIERRIACGELGECDYRQWPCQFPWLCDDPMMQGLEATTDDELEGVLVESIRQARERKMMNG